MKSAFDKISAGLEDAIAYAGGDNERGRIAAPVDVKAIRRATHLTQDQFARTFHLPIGTVRDWEQNRSQPDSGSKVYLRMIQSDPATVREMVAGFKLNRD
jgi:putative transcriptional regulator